MVPMTAASIYTKEYTMLSPEYKEALSALKEQAQTATAQLKRLDNKKANTQARSELQIIHERMQRVECEVRVIFKILMSSKDPGLTIETLDEQRLAKELGYS